MPKNFLEFRLAGTQAILGSKNSLATRNRKRQARIEWLKENKISKKIGRKISKALKGRIFTDEWKDKLRKAHLGQVAWNFGKQYLQIRGKNNPNWKGGITPINKALRHTLEYKLWRKAVFERDNYTCQDCGAYGEELQADHIKQFAYFPKLRFELSNGRTLCKPCHEKTPTYKNRKLVFNGI